MTKTSQRLQTVLRLAELKQQRAAEKLAVSIRNVNAQRQQARQIQDYQLEYAQRFQSSGGLGLNPAQLQNYQRFFSNLDSASRTQQQRCTLADAQQDQAREQWQQQYARQTSLQNLIEKKQHEETIAADKQEQRQQDDSFNNRRLLPD